MYYRTRTYIAADWSGDYDAVEQLHKWNSSRYWSLSFTDKPVVVIDAKYKLSGRPDRSDSHQLLSYVLLTGADRCGFVLPGEKTEVKEMVSTGDNYLPLAPRILRYYELLLGSKSDSSELQKVLQ